MWPQSTCSCLDRKSSLGDGSAISTVWGFLPVFSHSHNTSSTNKKTPLHSLATLHNRSSKSTVIIYWALATPHSYFYSCLGPSPYYIALLS